MARVTGDTPKELQTPPIPSELAYLWPLFFEIRRTPDPLTYTELRNWCDLKRIRLDPLEVDVLMRLDAITHRVRNDD
ncbi:phage tail assembly chaperone [Pseudomonas nitroreducens]|uniref:phage tail assembly chaperone n=1 Tax=Pseudomonas nitroreducens TaxID=46680 RepID=UPI003C7C4793